MKQNDLSLMSLFDGVGGFPIAWANVMRIKYEDLEYYSSEIEPFLINLTDNNLPKSKQLFDITKVDIEYLKSLNIDIITMGTPCTGFSVSGKREGLENEQSKLFENGVDIINQVRPKYFLWENVFGVFSSNERKEYREVLDQFKKIGYDTAWTILDSKFFGLPQRRRRVYMIGVRDGIQKNNNIFDFLARQSSDLIKKSKKADDFFSFDLNENSKSADEHYAFFNRQRSDKFKEVGISNTLTKRDYKDFTDVIIKNGSVRRVVPKERLRLQGIPDYWFDCSYKNTKSHIERYKANGMSIPVVEYVFENLIKIENGDCYSKDFDYKKTIHIDSSAHNINFDKKGNLASINDSGFMYLERDKLGNVISDNAEYHMVEKCSESSPIMNLKKIDDFLLDEVDDSFHIKKGGLEGILKREQKSDSPLPVKLKDVIIAKYPEFKSLYL